MENFRKFVDKMSLISEYFGAVLILAMFIINCIDIIGGSIFNKPLMGSVEMTGYLMAVLVPAACAQVFLNDQHIKIELATERLSEPVKRMMDRVVSFVIFCVFVVLSRQMFIYGMGRQADGEYSDTLHFPFYVIIYLIAIAFIPFCFALLRDMLSATPYKKK